LRPFIPKVNNLLRTPHLPLSSWKEVTLKKTGTWNEGGDKGHNLRLCKELEF